MLIKHLEEVPLSHISHLTHAWRLSFVLLLHGLTPWVWTHKVSDEISEL